MTTANPMETAIQRADAATPTANGSSATQSDLPKVTVVRKASSANTIFEERKGTAPHGTESGQLPVVVKKKPPSPTGSNPNLVVSSPSAPLELSSTRQLLPAPVTTAHGALAPDASPEVTGLVAPRTVSPVSPSSQASSESHSVTTACSTSDTVSHHGNGESFARGHTPRPSLSNLSVHPHVSLQRKGSMGKTALSRSASFSDPDSPTSAGPSQPITRETSSNSIHSTSSSHASPTTASPVPQKKSGFFSRVFKFGEDSDDKDKDPHREEELGGRPGTQSPRRGSRDDVFSLGRRNSDNHHLSTSPSTPHNVGEHSSIFKDLMTPQKIAQRTHSQSTLSSSDGHAVDSESEHQVSGAILTRSPSSHSLFRLPFGHKREPSNASKEAARTKLSALVINKATMTSELSPAVSPAPSSAGQSLDAPLSANPISPSPLSSTLVSPATTVTVAHPPHSETSKPLQKEDETRSHHSLFKDLIRGKSKRDIVQSDRGVAVSTDLTSASVTSSVSSETVPRGITLSFCDKYGKVDEVLGKGAYAVVKLAHKKEGAAEKCFAVKEFRKRKKDESEKDFMKKLTAEDEQHHWCEVMEYCAGGDLYARIVSGTLTDIAEINCYFKQLVLGVAYIHTLGIAHRDLKPENLLLDSEGRVLKISDFGVATIFRGPSDGKESTTKSKGIAGSSPYIAPEELTDSEYDAQKVDIWAAGVIYYTLLYNSVPWQKASKSDPHYKYFLSHRNGQFWPIDRLPPGQRKLVNRILDPNPLTRIKMEQILANEWFQSIPFCRSDGSCKSVLNPDGSIPHLHPKPIETHKLSQDQRNGAHDRYGSGSASGTASVRSR
ncbi:serine/threonine-protein kinase HAL4/sat4 [Gonapodya sp. JEL0774]|nr:serine/threonine-protein kinase HAL4/sat4 [Gonapodya sp. JEL0774]